MNEPNWDDIVEEAENSPRAVLAEVLAKVDDIDKVIIVFVDKDGKSNTWISAMSTYESIAILQYASWFECLKTRGNVTGEV